MTSREAFKLGFVARCLEHGLSLETMTKVASDGLQKMSSIFGDVARTGTSVLNTVLPLALAGPPIVGGLLGYGAARATDVDDRDVEDIKNQELVQTYNTETDRIKRQQALRHLLKGKLNV